MSIPHIEKKESVVVSQTIVNKTKLPKIISRESLVNGVLLTIVAILLFGILSTYFVEEIPAALLKFRDISKQALWVFVGGYAIGELLKIVFINRAHESVEYKAAKEEAEAKLAEIVEAKKTDRLIEYCHEYEERLFRENRELALAGSNISIEVFENKYVALNSREIRKRYPNDGLSKMQLKAIRGANAVKKERYDPEFLTSTLYAGQQNVPSARYNIKRRNVKNAVSSAITGAIGSLFGVSFANELIFNFTKEILVGAIIKLVMLALVVALKLIFANSLVFDTEIGRFNLQANEAKAYLLWYEKMK